jgi:hypothetical protein
MAWFMGVIMPQDQVLVNRNGELFMVIKIITKV